MQLRCKLLIAQLCYGINHRLIKELHGVSSVCMQFTIMQRCIADRHRHQPVTSRYFGGLSQHADFTWLFICVYVTLHWNSIYVVGRCGPDLQHNPGRHLAKAEPESKSTVPLVSSARAASKGFFCF